MGDFLGNYANGNSWCPYVSWQKQVSCFNDLSFCTESPNSILLTLSMARKMYLEAKKGFWEASQPYGLSKLTRPT